MIANTAPIKASSMISPVSEAKITCTPFAWVMGCTARTISSRGQQDQPQTDPHPSKLPSAGLLAAEEENHPDKYQQRRQPRQIEGQHPRHQRRPDVGPQHHHQRWHQTH